ncbi:hypothetical protein [Paenibacillus xylanilyticus]|uniref:hypothetical protein n=1 Tax=Paenibacillus xylanilyticus TaxID=248903 RepID=UPI0039A0548A
MKKYLVSLFAATFILSSSTAAFASADTTNNGEVTPSVSTAQLEVQANNPAKINEALESGLVVDESNPVATYTFDDGSYIQLTSSVSQNRSLPSLIAPAANGIWTADVTLSAHSAVTGDTLLLWSYTLKQEYITDGNKITWYNSVPSTSFYSPIWSLWNLDGEVAGVGPGPSSGTIRATSSIKTSFGIWEINPQTTNGELILNIKGDGSYTSSSRKWS